MLDKRAIILLLLIVSLSPFPCLSPPGALDTCTKEMERNALSLSSSQGDVIKKCPSMAIHPATLPSLLPEDAKDPPALRGSPLLWRKHGQFLHRETPMSSNPHTLPTPDQGISKQATKGEKQGLSPYPPMKTSGHHMSPFLSPTKGPFCTPGSV